MNSPSAPPDPSEDPELARVWSALLRSGYVEVLPELLRETFDQIYDGQRTGRWDYEQLNKTEKTHIGTLVQINIQNELEIPDNPQPKKLDYLIDGIEVDCKWSRVLYGWEIPREMYERGPKIALLVWGNDYTSCWATGLLRITDDMLKPEGRQGDKKRRLSDLGCRSIVWLGLGRNMVKNTLLSLGAGSRRRILESRSGQSAVTEMFRTLEGVLVNRATVLTVAQQDDCPKRVRDARKALKPEGIVIFGHYKPHPDYAGELGLPRPTRGRFVSVRLAPVEAETDVPTVVIGGRRYRRAGPEEPFHVAPGLPRQGSQPDED